MAHTEGAEVEVVLGAVDGWLTILQPFLPFRTNVETADNVSPPFLFASLSAASTAFVHSTLTAAVDY